MKKIKNLDIPIKNMYETLQEDKEWENTIYCSVTYHTLLIEKSYMLNDIEEISNSFNCTYQILDNKLDQWNSLLDYDNRELLGSWRDLNAPRLSKRSILTLLHNLGCTLNRIGRYSESLDIFKKALSKGHKLNKYGLALYLSSVWNSEKRKEEVLKQFDIFNNDFYDIRELMKFAPELKDVQ